MRNIIEIDEDLCNGCGKCVLSCAEGAIRLVDGKARLMSEKYCDGLGACLGDCPTGALKIIQREADDFDEEAVAKHVKPIAPRRDEAPEPQHACPGSQVRRFTPAAAVATQSRPRRDEDSASALTHWPVQIRLVPPSAPFLQGADLLVSADCVPVSYANFHRDFLAGKVVLVGCPKFDDVDLYVQRFTDMFTASDIRSVTVVVMQVPCCQGLPMIVHEGMRASGKHIPIEKIVITLQGEILRRETLVA
jgi:NAD-dependent dihydropyrimidine dehydrogenase PreA subunit